MKLLPSEKAKLENAALICAVKRETAQIEGRDHLVSAFEQAIKSLRYILEQQRLGDLQ